ncbi:MAG TPA: hypothetical protein VGN07_17970 [Steroidobacteraceae bacterium]|jgi:hypothetical protein
MTDQNTSPVVYTIFCDDLRQEVGNKVSYMGVYQGILYVEAFPVFLPKLCAAVTLRVLMDRRPKRLLFRMLMEDTVIAERAFDTQLMAQDQTAVDTNHDAIYATALFQFTPFAAEAPARLKSRVYFDDQELKAGALNIRMLPKAEGAV